VAVEHVEQPEDRTSETVSIARCRDLLGDDAKGMSDDDIASILHHADAVAHTIVQMFLETHMASE